MFAQTKNMCIFKLLKNSLTYLLFFALSIWSFVLPAQNTIDSLKLALTKVKHDTLRCNILHDLIEAEGDEAIWPKYNQLLKELSETNAAKEKDPLIKLFYLKHLANTLNNIAFLAQQHGDIPKALEYFDKSLKIREQTNEKTGIAQSFNNIGYVYAEQGNNAKALEYSQKALKLYELIKDQKGISSALINIGALYYEQNNFSKALECFQKSLTLNEKINDKAGIAISLNNIANIYSQQKDDEKALEYHQKSLKMHEEMLDMERVATSLNNIASLLLKKQKVNEAFNYANRSLEIARKLGHPEKIRNAAIMLSSIYKKQNNYFAAFETYKLYIKMRDSINNEQTRKASIKNQLKYEFEKKEAILKEQQEKERIIAEEKNRFQQIIIASVFFGLLLVIVFAIFIFRSLKTTKEQKLIIEEKQKEILDSIKYAKRIQSALLPGEKYIQKNLDRLNKK